MADKGLLPGEFRIGATIHLPAERGYEERVAAWKRLVRHAPALVVAARDATDVALVVRLAAALAGHLTGYVPLNFFSARDRVETAFRPDHLERPREVKHSYDPLNVFGGDRALVERTGPAPIEGESR